MRGLITGLLLAGAAWTAQVPGAPGAQIAAFFILFFELPTAALAVAGVLMMSDAQVRAVDGPALWRGPSALRWVAVAGTLVCLVHTGHIVAGGGLWLAELLTGGALTVLRARRRGWRE